MEPDKDKSDSVKHKESKPFEPKSHPQKPALSETPPVHTTNKSSLNLVSALKTVCIWLSAAIALCGLAVSIYYGFWALKYQSWSAFNDFRGECRNARVKKAPIFIHV
jgi:hypothetical protein